MNGIRSDLFSMQPPKDPNDPLELLFERSRNAAPEPAENLESTVWRRIAAAENPGRLGGLLDRIEAIFARPSFKVAFVAGCVLFGLLLAETRVSQMQAKRSVQFVQSYLRQIDPQLDDVGTQSASASVQP